MVKRILAASAWLTVGSFCLVQNAIASESFSCNLTKFMEVANDGTFFGPETIEEFLTLELRDEKVFVESSGPAYSLPLIDKLGTAQFAAKGGIAAMEAIHVWRRLNEEVYEIQSSTNYASSIVIRTGLCVRTG